MTPISQIFLSRYYQQTRMFHMIPYKTQFACSMFTIDVRSKMSCQKDELPTGSLYKTEGRTTTCWDQTEGTNFSQIH